ncbi:hypothetical protein UCRPC4_g00329 [Phaeomoniella chlamydospora]|uniref:Uncharacterized protein n=1 Tax=Phaeomoniella chlamydospora TaxID=158046 RepID=A0A0G2HKS2_PHACM|nr:hypothetical protein UCRPC4_g00329 [Phaeomoniella chlamydospora]
MIPPLAPSTISTNPQFASLYKHLATEVLNPDCSTASRYPNPSAHSATSAAGNERVRERVNDVVRGPGPTAEGPTQARQKATLAQRQELWMKLRESRLRRAKREIISSSLRHAAATAVATIDTDGLDRTKAPGLQRPPRNAVTQAAKDLMLTVSMVLEDLMTNGSERASKISSNDLDILYQELIPDFEENINAISSLVSQEIMHKHTSLVNLVSPSPSHSSKPSSHPKPRSKPLLHTILPASPSTTLIPIPSLLPSLLSFLTTHHTLLSTLISHLSLTLHGTQTRHLRTRTNHLHTVSEGMSLKSLVLLSRSQTLLYGSPEIQTALSRYWDWLSDISSELESRKLRVKEILRDEYGQIEDLSPPESDSTNLPNNNQSTQRKSQQGRKIKEIGKLYSKLLHEESQLKTEIEKLEMKNRAGGNSHFENNKKY